MLHKMYTFFSISFGFFLMAIRKIWIELLIIQYSSFGGKSIFANVFEAKYVKKKLSYRVAFIRIVINCYIEIKKMKQ